MGSVPLINQCSNNGMVYGDLQVSVSSAGMPSGVDATIESNNVSPALFDVFFGDEPVSPSLKAAVSNGLATALK